MRKILFIWILLIIGANTFGQIVESKPIIDKPLSDLLKTEKDNISINVLIKLKPNQSIKSNDFIKINSRFGNLVTAQVKLNDIEKLLKNYNIQSVEFGGYEAPVMDSVKYHTFTWGVQKGWGGIDRAYQGEDIIVGIVDSGIDFDHKEFREQNDATKTRIQSIWCQWDTTGNKPDSFSYGSVYTQKQLEDEINGITQNAIPNTDYDPTNRGGLGHGTHVAGISSGINGMAPKSQIIAVSLLWTSASVIDGIKFVIDEAIRQNKPCVVNLSLGSMFDIHDGTGTKADAYKALANLRPEGTIICAAAGNSGSSNLHWGNFSADTLKSTYFYGDPIQLVMAIPDSVIDSLKFKVTGFTGNFDYSNDVFDSLEEFRSSKWITPGKLTVDSFYEDLYYKGQFEIGATVEAVLRPKSADSDYRMFILEIDDHADIDLRQKPPKANGIDLFRIDVEGSGDFNAWLMYISPTFSGSFSKIATDPEAIGAPEVTNYQLPDNDFTIIAPAVYNETFTVGAYVNRWSYFDVLGQQQPPRWARKPAGSYATFSSKGPSVDGRILPEIMAPGQNVLSAIPDYYTGWSPKVKDGNYASNSGTSMSTPVVSGAVALYLEKFPNATLSDVRADFLSNTYEDEFTESNGQLPNNYWGFGKLDVYRIMSDGIFFSQHQFKNSNIKIYPNPSSSLINIEGKIEKHDATRKQTIDIHYS